MFVCVFGLGFGFVFVLLFVCVFCLCVCVSVCFCACGCFLFVFVFVRVCVCVFAFALVLVLVRVVLCTEYRFNTTGERKKHCLLGEMYLTSFCQVFVHGKSSPSKSSMFDVMLI